MFCAAAILYAGFSRKEEMTPYFVADFGRATPEFGHYWNE